MIAACPKLRTDLVVTRQESVQEVFVVIKDPRADRYFRVREPEYWLISQFDGATPYDDIRARFAEKFGATLPDGAVEAFAQKLAGLSFLETTGAEWSATQVSRTTEGARSRLSRILYFKLKAFDPTRGLDILLRLYRPLHGRVLFSLSVVVILIGVMTLWAHRSEFAIDIRELFTLVSISTIIFSFAGVIFLHELGHVVTLRLHGGQVKDVGFLLLFFQLCFYSDLSDAWLLRRKRDRLAVIWAGPFVQLCVMALAVLIWRVTFPGTALNEISRLGVMVCAVTFLFNLNPLLKLDGYFLLSDYLEIPNLQAKAFRYLRVVCGDTFLGIRDEEGVAWVAALPKRHRRLFAWYAWLSMSYGGLLIGYFVGYAGGYLIRGLGAFGALLLAALVGLMFGQQIGAIGRYLAHPITAMKNVFSNRKRAFILGPILIGLGILIFFVPFPFRVGGETTIAPLSEYLVTIGDGGQIRTEYRRNGTRPEIRPSFLNVSALDMSALDVTVRARPGDRVKSGDTILTLNSNQVSAELEGARSSLANSEARLALLKSPPKPESLQVLEADAEGVRSELDHLRAELSRKQGLFAKNLISQSELDKARSEVEIADAHWRMAKSTLTLFKSPPKLEAEAVIRADIRQQVSHIAFLESQFAAQVLITPISGVALAGDQRSTAVHIIAIDTAEARIALSDFDIGVVQVGQSVILKFRSQPSRAFTGVVCRIAAAGTTAQDINSGADPFEVSALIVNDSGSLRPGMTGYAKIEIGRATLAQLALRKVASLFRIEFWSLW